MYDCMFWELIVSSNDRLGRVCLLSSIAYTSLICQRKVILPIRYLDTHGPMQIRAFHYILQGPSGQTGKLVQMMAHRIEARLVQMYIKQHAIFRSVLIIVRTSNYFTRL